MDKKYGQVSVRSTKKSPLYPYSYNIKFSKEPDNILHVSIPGHSIKFNATDNELPLEFKDILLSYGWNNKMISGFEHMLLFDNWVLCEKINNRGKFVAC